MIQLDDSNTVIDLRQLYEWTSEDYKRRPKRLVVNPNWQHAPISDVETWVQFIPAFVITGSRIEGADTSFNRRAGQKAYLSGWDRLDGKCQIIANWPAQLQLENNPESLRYQLARQGAGYSMSYDSQVHRIVLSQRNYCRGLARSLMKDWFPWASGFVVNERLLPLAENQLPRVLRDDYNISTLMLS